MRSIKTSLAALRLDIGRYPTEAEGLSLLVQAPGDGVPGWAGPYMQELPNDPWGVPYQYIPPGEDGEARVATLGEDNKEGGTGSNADIVM